MSRPAEILLVQIIRSHKSQFLLSIGLVPADAQKARLIDHARK